MKDLIIVDEIGSLEYIFERQEIYDVAVPKEKLDIFTKRFNANIYSLDDVFSEKLIIKRIIFGLTPTIHKYQLPAFECAEFYIDTSISLQNRLQSPLLDDCREKNSKIYFPGNISELPKGIRENFIVKIYKRNFSGKRIKAYGEVHSFKLPSQNCVFGVFLRVLFGNETHYVFWFDVTMF